MRQGKGYNQKQIIVLTMNMQQKSNESILKFQTLNQPFKKSQFIERVLATHSKIKKQKSITIANFFQCSDEAEFGVAIAKFVIIFQIDISSIDCFKKLADKELNSIKNFNFESIHADTNRKKFAKFFKKSTDPQLSLSAPFSNNQGVILIIQSSEDENEKCNIKFLNYQNLMHSILSFIKEDNNFEKLSKFLQAKYKKISTAVCFEKTKNRQINKHLYQFLLTKFEEVIFVGLSDNHKNLEFNTYEQKTQVINNRNLILYENQDWQILGTNSLTKKSVQQIFRYYENYSEIDDLIIKQIDKSKIHTNDFQKNQLCINYYGIYYNFILLNGVNNCCNQFEASRMFLEQFIKEKDMILAKTQKKQKKVINRKKGHYPDKIQKGSKVCCVCEKEKKKKSRFKCEKCSETYSKDIAICLDHFKEFHQNISKYLPKGVKQGTHQNEILQFKSKTNIEQKQPSKKQTLKKQIQKNDTNVSDILSKWEQRISTSEPIFNNLAHIVLQNSIMEPYLHQLNQYFYHQMHPDLPAPRLFREQVKQETEFHHEFQKREE